MHNKFLHKFESIENIFYFILLCKKNLNLEIVNRDVAIIEC